VRGNIAVTSGRTLRLETTDSFTVGDSANDLTGGGTIVKASTGTVVLAQSSNFTGSWSLDAGTLQIASDNVLGGSSSSLTLNGGTVTSNGNFTLATNVNVGYVSGSANFGGGTINVAGGNLTLANGLDFAGVTLTKQGTGTLILQGPG